MNLPKETKDYEEVGIETAEGEGEEEGARAKFALGFGDLVYDSGNLCVCVCVCVAARLFAEPRCIPEVLHNVVCCLAESRCVPEAS